MRIGGEDLPDHDIGSALSGGHGRRQRAASCPSGHGDLACARAKHLDAVSGGGDGFGEGERNRRRRPLENRIGHGVGEEQQRVGSRGHRVKSERNGQADDHESPAQAQE